MGTTPFPSVFDVEFNTSADTYLVGPELVDGLQTRYQFKFFGDRRLVRVLYIFTNSGGSDLTRTITVDSDFGSGLLTGVRGSSSGDAVLATGDRWVITSDDATMPDDPVVTSVLYGPDASVVPGSVLLSDDRLSAQYSLSVPAGQTRALMLFTGLDDLDGVLGTNEAAIASAALFDDSSAFEMEGLLTDFAGVQTSEVVNWDLETADTTPNAFNFPNKTQVATDTLVNAVAQIISGIDAPAQVVLSGAASSEFLTNSNPTWRTTGTVNNNEALQVRHRSAATAETMTTTTVCIGPTSAPVCDDYSTTTAAADDATPNAFSFTGKTGLQISTLTESVAVGITGFSVPVSATIDIGQFRIGGGPWVTSGTVSPNDAVRIRNTTSATSLTNVVSTLTVGGVSGSFTTRTGDAVPNAFSFAAKRDQPFNTLAESPAATLAGLTIATTARVTGGEVRVGPGPWTTGEVTVQNGSVVRVRHTTAGADLTDTTTTLCVGPVSQQVCRNFVTTTVDTNDFTPNAFGWPNKTNVAKNTAIDSLYRQITGFFGTLELTIDNGQFRVSGGPWVTSAMISSGASIQVRHTSAAGGNASTISTLTVGGVSGSFTTVTGP